MGKKKIKAILLGAESWCASCRTMKPLFIKECKELGVRFEVLDVEEEDGLNLSIKHKVRNVPTILFFKDGELIGRETGNTSYEKIKDYINE